MVPKPKPVKEKKGKKRRPKSERSLLESRLDLLVSTIVILRDGRCVTCGAMDELTCSHFVKRGKSIIRWDLENCNCQCGGCNLSHNSYQGAYRRYIIDHYGSATLERLHGAEAIEKYQWPVIDLRDLRDSLEAECQHFISLQTDPLRVEWAVKRLS
jgi:hypothetical protein